MRLPDQFKIKTFTDQRGSIAFCNDFSLDKYKRFYMISPAYKDQIRAWQGHKLEGKAFQVLTGKIKLVLIPIIDLSSEKVGTPFEFFLDDSHPAIISIPGGYLNGFQFLSSDSRLMVYSTMSVEESKSDDYRFDADKFYDW